MKLDKTLDNLKRLLEADRELIQVLTAKKDGIVQNLQDAQERASRTEEAILALEGKSNQIKEALMQAVQHAAKQDTLPGAANTNFSLPPTQNKDLPPAEPGYKWTKVTNELGVAEDVLIPLNGQVVHAADANNFVVPMAEEDEFPDPSEQIS